MSLLRPGAKDPRHIVTADAFGVATELLGRPLARPWRRGVALLADLLCVFLLTQLGSLSAALAARDAAALRDGDETRLAELGPRVEELISAATTARLEQRVQRLRTNSRELYSEIRKLREKVENPSFMRVLTGFSADFGLTLGWSGVYFRVISLDHRPLGLWSSFERFAGYTAGIATGLFGFLQILWDPNRQGIQEKIVSTVVVLEPRGARTEITENVTGR